MTTLVGDARRWRYYTLGPAVAVFLALTALPIVNLLVMSVHDVRWEQGVAQWTFVGTKHFAELPADQLFRDGLANTALFAVLAVSAELLLGFFLALLTSRVVRGRLFYRTAFLLPILI